MILHLAYHYVRRPDQEVPQGPACSVERFRRQLAYLADNRWEAPTCGEFANWYRGEKLLAADKMVTLSFDDGLADGYVNALPLLREFGFRGTFFVITCTLAAWVPAVIKFQRILAEAGAARVEKELLPKALAGTLYPLLLDPARFALGDLYGNEEVKVRRAKVVFNRFVPQALREEASSAMFTELFGTDAEAKLARELFMGEAMLREMHGAGMEIASHSDWHPFMGQLAESEIAREVDDAADTLESVVGESPRSFGWPFGGVFPEKAHRIVGKRHTSAWNYGTKAEMPQPPYPILDIPRVDEKYMEEVLGIPPLG